MVPLSWLKADIMVLEYPSRAYTKCVATSGSNGWAHLILNTMYIPLTIAPGYTQIRYILDGRSCVMVLTWLKADIMVLEHPFGTYIKYVATPGRND